jgi:mannose-6-phosphate isomerase-like protein (cupin superfamily)
MPILEGGGRFERPAAPRTAAYLEHLRTEDLSVGTYSISAGGHDGQSPHTEDEIYVVTAGRATFVDDGGSHPIAPGDVLFVRAGAEHRFVDITEDLALVVVFAPPEESKA